MSSKEKTLSIGKSLEQR